MINMYELQASSRKQRSGNQRSLLWAKREVQLGVCRPDSRLPSAKMKKKGKRGRKKFRKKFGLETRDEGREFISETPFDFPGRKILLKNRATPVSLLSSLPSRFPLKGKHE